MLNEYLDLSLAQYFALEEQILKKLEREDYRAGLLDARLRNLGGAKKTHPFDSFPHWKQKRKNKREDVQQNIRNSFAALKKLAKKKDE